ncbi:MAG: DUF2975 domain-containing protein [Chitinophagaceae bacterium]
MLSSFLSRIFWLAFIIMLLGAMGNIISQITQKPLIIQTSKNSSWTLGQPGLVFEATISNLQNEKRAPDTTVNYSYTFKSGESSNGEFSINAQWHDFRKNLDSIIKHVKAKGEEIKLDTAATLIGETQWEQLDYSQAFSGVDSVNPNKFIFRETYQDEKGKIIKEDTDTFTTQADANRFMYLNQYKTPYKIVEEIYAEQSLRIFPKNRLQQFYFLLCVLINTTSLALLFLSLSNLFRNFSNKYYFTFKNIHLLKRVGWFILIPQIMNVIFYWTVLFRIRPAKIFIPFAAIDKVKLLAQYDLQAGINWQLIFVGLGMIVLGIIFKSGLKLKEEQALTV